MMKRLMWSAATVAALLSTAAGATAANGGASGPAVVASRLRLVKVQPTKVIQEGTFTSARLGSGRLRATSTRQGNSSKFRTRTTLTLRHGTLRLAGVNTVSNRNSDTLAVRGTTRIVSGTGVYRHAHGRFTVSGTGPRSLSWLSLTLRGAIG